MRLEFVEFEGFRGFRHRTLLQVPSGFMVIVGRNGVGKSTILDAIDFALTGNINKFDVQKAKGGGLQDHIWWLGEGKADSNFVRVGFIDDFGTRFEVTRHKDRLEADGLNEVLEQIQDRSKHSIMAEPQAVMESTLIRDEVISSSSLDLPGQQRFNAVKAAIGSITGPDYSNRTAAIFDETQLSLRAERNRADALQADLGRLLTQLTEARSEAAQSSDVAEAIALVSKFVPLNGREPTDVTLRAWIADRRAALTRFEAARERMVSISGQKERIGSDEFSFALNQARSTVQEYRALAVAKQEIADAASRLLSTEQDADFIATHFAALLEHGSSLGLQEGHCPLCDAARTDPEFAAALSRIRERLHGRAETLRALEDKVLQAHRDLEAVQVDLSEALKRFDALSDELAFVEAAEKEIRQEYELAGYRDLSLDDLQLAEALAYNQQQEIVQLERASLILGASSAMERVASLETQIEKVRAAIDRQIQIVASTERAVESARQINNAARGLANEILVEQFETVMPLLKELYRRLRPHNDWTEIDTDFGGKVRASLNFSVGDGRNPQFLFSSGQRRAAGLAFLLAIHLSRPWCRWKSLLLDDPVQHVDDYRALNLVEVLAAIRRSGRQVVIAVEDAALADLLCRRLRSSTSELGVRFDLGHAPDGSAKIEAVREILPFPNGTLKMPLAS